MGLHLLGVHLLLDEGVYQLFSILVHQLFTLVPDGAGKVAADKLHLALNLRIIRQVLNSFDLSAPGRWWPRHRASRRSR